MTTLLIVDDEETIRRTLARALSRGGYEVDVAENAPQALERIEAREYDVILCDILLPGMSGLELLQQIHRKHLNSIVILITGAPSAETAAEALRAGAYDYLTKPLGAKDVQRVVDNAARLKALNDEKRRLEEENLRYQSRLESLVEERTAKLRESESRLRAIFERAAIGIARSDLGGRILESNPAFQRMLGYTGEELRDMPVADLTHPDDWPFEQAMLRKIRESAEDVYTIEKRYIRKDGHTIWGRLTVSFVRNEKGEPEFAIGMVEDITARKTAEERLRHDALHDPLTTLPNRTLLLDRIQQAILQSQRDPSRRFALLLFDLDDFKNVNDSFGHMTGDSLLIECAQRRQRRVRPQDTVARVGGDEFVLLVETLSESHAAELAARQLEMIATPFSVGRRTIHMTASAGVVTSDSAERTPEEFLRDADTAMYRAKRAGKNVVATFDPEMREAIGQRLAMENDFRQGMRTDQLQPHYQPIVNLADGRIVAFEALLRWNHPERGEVPPGLFIPLAEETGLIVPLGEWLLERTAREVKTWLRRFGQPLTLNVNLSLRQVSRSEIAGVVERILTATQFPPECLTLEITESVLADQSVAPETFDRLKALGVRLSLDDFGTGYSSLSHLQRFPIDQLKIDPSFVARMRNYQADAEIIRAVLALAHAFQLSVIAEGVETREQEEDLRAIGCDFAQGFYYGHPMNAEGTERALERHFAPLSPAPP